MILHNTALLYIISLFNRKVRQKAILTFECSVIVALFVSQLVYDQLTVDNDTTALDREDEIMSFVDSNGNQYNVTDK